MKPKLISNTFLHQWNTRRPHKQPMRKREFMFVLGILDRHQRKLILNQFQTEQNLFTEFARGTSLAAVTQHQGPT